MLTKKLQMYSQPPSQTESEARPNQLPRPESDGGCKTFECGSRGRRARKRARKIQWGREPARAGENRRNLKEISASTIKHGKRFSISNMASAFQFFNESGSHVLQGMVVHPLIPAPPAPAPAPPALVPMLPIWADEPPTP